MKKSLLALAIGCAALATACGESPKAETQAAKKPAAAETKGNLPNYRYVDIDTILSRYNLAKDYNEEMMRMQNNMESEMKRHQNNIQSLANQMQKKVQNNSYLSQESYQQDEQKLATLQNNAQKAVGTLQNNYETAAIKAQQAVNDSIEAFIRQYNSTRGYDAILFKNATLYINPALDITDEVVEGLNARYNKVKK